MRSTPNWGEPDSIQLPTISVLCCSQSTSSPHTRFHWAGATSVIVWSMANRKYKFVQFIAKITTTKHSTGVWWRNPVDNTAQPQTQSIAATRHYQSWCSASWWWWWWTTYTTRFESCYSFMYSLNYARGRAGEFRAKDLSLKLPSATLCCRIHRLVSALPLGALYCRRWGGGKWIIKINCAALFVLDHYCPCVC